MSKINGFTMDSAAVQQMAGLSLEELIQKTIGKNFQEAMSMPRSIFFRSLPILLISQV